MFFEADSRMIDVSPPLIDARHGWMRQHVSEKNAGGRWKRELSGRHRRWDEVEAAQGGNSRTIKSVCCLECGDMLLVITVSSGCVDAVRATIVSCCQGPHFLV